MLFYTVGRKGPCRDRRRKGRKKMSEHEEIPEARGGIPMSSGSLSVYRHGGDALDDFPVLKAFQQYVDAEQAKAHKRLMTVCVFFTMLILAVTGVFLFIIFEMNRKAAGEDPTLKALSDSNAALQKQMLDQTVKMNERFMTQMSSDRGHPVSAADADLQRRNLELQAKLNALEIENRLRAERAAEDEKRRAAEAAKPKPAAPGMTQEEQAAKIRQFKQAAAAIHEREEALRKKEESLKAREAKAAAEEASLKQRAKQLHRQALYPEYFDEEGNEMPQPVRRRPAAAAPQPAPTARPAARPAPRPAAARPAAPAPAPAPAASTERDDIDELDDILPPLESETATATPETAPAPAPTPKPVAAKPAAAPKPAAKPAVAKPAARPVAKKAAVSPDAIIAPQPAAPQPQAPAGETMLLDVNGANSAWTIPLE